MVQGRRPIPPARPARARAALAAAGPAFVLAASLAGCAEVHRGVEAVGRVGSSATPPPVEAAPARSVGAPMAAVPSARDIFDFHPGGAPRDSWRQPFIIDTNDGPLAADVRRSSAELKAFLASKDRMAAPRPRGCSETDVAVNKPGCGDAKAAPAP